MARGIPVLVCVAAALAALMTAMALAASHGNHHQERHTPGQAAVVKEWARRLGRELTVMANAVTRHQRLQDNYAKKAVIGPRDHEKILDTVARRLRKVMKRRVEQVQRIREAAESLTAEYTELNKMDVPRPYLGVKDIETTEVPTVPPSKPPKRSIFASATTTPPPTTPMPTPPTTTPKPWLTKVDSFPAGELINVSFSAVHVPASVYDGRWINYSLPDHAMEYNSTGAEVQRIIELTEELDDVFHENWLKDKSTSWQYFAHRTGAMRQYPASKWKTLYHEDYYDARLRPWYLGAAMSPKDVVILLDNSGSIRMTEPSKLTKLVVNNILNTLGPDDFVTVLLFNDTTLPLLPGFNESLIPATSAYVREMQHALEGVTPKGVANLSLALRTAFQLLEKYRADDAIGASCNQAVMLVTDVVPEHAEDLFRQHNRPTEDQPETHARVFTFVVQDWAKDPSKEAQWMACANMGWYKDIWEYETDEVYNFVPVMARPVMLAAKHPVHWSHMYADVTVPGMTDKLWASMQHDEQLRKVTPFCFKHAEIVQRKSVHKMPAQRHWLERLPIEEKELWQHEEYVITVSTAARNMSEAGLPNGDLLGVAGVDILVSELILRIPHHLVGVNSYVFMVTNNGMIVFHPDLRPRFNGILRPGFNSVDMVDIELEDYPFPRNMSDSMRDFRERVVSQTTGSMTLAMIRTYNNWNRVSAKASRKYWFRGVDNSPYSLVLAVAAPENSTCHRIKPAPDRSITFDKLKVLLGKNPWAVHPEWRYCGYCCGVAGRDGLRLLGPRLMEERCVDDADDADDADDLAAAVRQQDYRLDRDGSSRVKVKYEAKKQDEDKEDEHPFELASALAADAEMTRFWNEPVKDWKVWDRWEASIAFVATHSGLTRWLTRRRNVAWEEPRPAPGTRGPGEVWYRRAVEEGLEHSADFPHWVVSVHLADEDSADVYSEYTASYNPDDPWAARKAGLADSWTGVPARNLTTSGTSETVEEVGAREVTMAAMAMARPKAERVPAAVAGLRLPQRKLQQLFSEITGTLTSCPGQSTSCAQTCLSESLDCYLLDENAFVVTDKTGLEAGRPLALVNPDLLVRLERANVYTRTTVNDHQGVCRRPPKSTATATTPSSGACWAGAALAALWWRQGQHHHGVGGNLVPAAAMLLGGARTILAAAPTLKTKESTASPEEISSALAPLRVNKTILHLCVVLRDLHRVGPGVQTVDSPSPHHPRLNCTDDTPFVAVSVPGTSLMLVVAKKGCPPLEQPSPFRTEPYEDVISAENPAVRKEGLLWPRRRPGSCYREHIGERNITMCGAATRTAGAAASLAALLALAVMPLLAVAPSA